MTCSWSCMLIAHAHAEVFTTFVAHATTRGFALLFAFTIEAFAFGLALAFGSASGGLDRGLLRGGWFLPLYRGGGRPGHAPPSANDNMQESASVSHVACSFLEIGTYSEVMEITLISPFAMTLSKEFA